MPRVKRKCPVCDKMMVNVSRHLKNVHKQGKGLVKIAKKARKAVKKVKKEAENLEFGAKQVVKKVKSGHPEKLVAVQALSKVIPKQIKEFVRSNRSKARRILLEVKGQVGSGIVTRAVGALSLAGLAGVSGALIFREYLLRNPGMVAKLLASSIMGSGINEQMISVGAGINEQMISVGAGLSPSGNGFNPSGNGLRLAGQRGTGFIRRHRMIKMIRPHQGVKTLRSQKRFL